MKTIKGIKVPETLGDARKMNYEELKKACDVFNNHGMSTEDLQNNIKRMQDESFWEGFDAAVELVLNYFDNCDMHTLPIVSREELIDEIDLYKKDG